MAPRVVVMARAPVPGRCKTRLEPLLGPDGCAALQRELVRHTLACCPPGRTVVAEADGRLGDLVPATATTFAQEGPHLGARLAHAVATAGAPVLVIGTDLPSLRPDDLAHAEAALDGRDVVFGPADDGGWWLCALRAPAPEVFTIDPRLWGGPAVLDACLAAARAAGRRVGLVGEPRQDLDTPQDAARAVRDPATAPEVAAVLRAGV
ncbi:MAG TPA: TIGR04282 family arsenosugar biosynthesis glycosyltransferase [Baekduia sp.]|nr:TIGR04282 family arsenosugar biosynthesis glycosyltransferase [Baekduia sp.]